MYVVWLSFRILALKVFVFKQLLMKISDTSETIDIEHHDTSLSVFKASTVEL